MTDPIHDKPQVSIMWINTSEKYKELLWGHQHRISNEITLKLLRDNFQNVRTYNVIFKKARFRIYF